MMNLILQRLNQSPIIPTFGVLIAESGIPFALTLERPWLNNARGVSCIPLGSYTCRRVMSPKFGSTFEVINVQGRQEILLHKGNIEEDSHGCILIGEQFEPLNGEPAILASAKGFQEFLDLTELMDNFNLFVRGIS